MKDDLIYLYDDSCCVISYKVYLNVKRILDIIISLLGCIILLPIAIMIKIIYVLNGDYNTIFYSHFRIGKNGKKINIYKFRTMVMDADKILKDILKDKKYRKEWNETQKLKKDPRVTKVGKMLRDFSIDEIPQFINVLKGDLSLIGPRPLVKGELDKHNGNHKLYESITPGITGWWACQADKVATYQERLDLEYYYVKNCCFILDLKCFFKTILILFKSKGNKK